MAFQTIRVTEQEKELLITVLEKRIYLGVTDIFSEEINQTLTMDVDTFIINMSNVSVMNSSGIGVLIKARGEITKMGKTLKLWNLQPLMKDIFDRMRLDTLFDIS